MCSYVCIFVAKFAKIKYFKPGELTAVCFNFCSAIFHPLHPALLHGVGVIQGSRVEDTFNLGLVRQIYEGQSHFHV